MLVLKVLLIIAKEGYQPIEYGYTRTVLEDAGIQVVVASNTVGVAQAARSDNNDLKRNALHLPFMQVHVDVALNAVKPHEYDGIFIIGGPGALEHLDNHVVYSLMQSFAQLARPFGAICVSPRILAKAGLLKGKKATGWDEDNLLAGIFKEHGVVYRKGDVITDGNVITARDPQAASAFGKAIVEALKRKTK